MSYRWEDDAYPGIDAREDWTEKERMVAAGNAARRKALRRETTEGDDDV